ncbi:acyltransferase domain-containing protein [Agrobacterium vitis]|uniref:type I polyketide synthase n=1 Tax=Rhizobium/Agrobacterium group TaxID=227290 RepID=UPI0012E8C447|nr:MULTISPECIES: type I polyketide synthase [Rhizobium/Agrobacterium group]MCF1496230.1 acyltransferase domain-containing protein [Allorhizobium ampelinum]MVA48947.1 acyltransferase domain-containing protein [Agrobacterium vitis]
MKTTETNLTGLEIAIVGMAGRFPGAADLDGFWRNLVEGRESITRWSRNELRAQGVAAEMLDAPNFVPVGAPLEGLDRFDAEFFGYSPREAEILDPQQRIFLECAWHALETAGYSGACHSRDIGVFASAGMNGYLFNLYDNAETRASVSSYELFIASDKDFLATRTAYKLNLRGPAITVQSACSSSLVAVHLAVQSLLAGECDMALAGGAALSRQRGYRAQEGSILSADGHCRAFDAKATGTVPGNGVAAVVLKRLEDALADGDTINAVILGSAVNNDGGLKASFTAPQVDSQAAVIAAAQAASGVEPDSISYIEAHGTGTVLGDPIELAALTQAFRRKTDRRGFCALGSVKTNIGHLDTAAGIAGLIKAALMLRHGKIPPSLHYTAPNPQIDFAASPFFVNTELRDWPRSDAPRRAGVSSFGIGGTNCHVILEEAPVPPDVSASTAPQALLLSARNEATLASMANNLAAHLEHPGAPALADVAYTLREGRRSFAHRQCVVASDPATAAKRLRLLGDFRKATLDTPPDPVLLFPGQGSQYARMARKLHAAFPAFRDAFDACASRLDELLQRNFSDWLFGDAEGIHQTALTQPALFAVEYGLGRLWLAMGVEPRALHGHSIGEYVAACLAGVFDLNTALKLVVERGRLMQAATPGAMLAVIHPDGRIEPWLGDNIALAASNAPGLSVLSGPEPAIVALEKRLEAAGIGCKRLRTSHAFHSPMMADAAEEFKKVVASATLNAPALPVISNLSGTWLSSAEATDPDYWTRHLLGTVRFGDGTATLLALPRPVFIECGPGKTLSTLTSQQADGMIDVIPGLSEGSDDVEQMLSAAGLFWRIGGAPDWTPLETGKGRRAPLPTYPFQSERYWIEPDNGAAVAARRPTEVVADSDPSRWFYRPSWRREPVNAEPTEGRGRWLIFDDGQIGGALAERMEATGQDAYRVLATSGFGEPDYRCFAVALASAADHKALLAALAEREASPDHVVFLWSLNPAIAEDGLPPVQALQTLIDALAVSPRPIRLTVITRGAVDVTGTETLLPEQALIQGLLQVAGQEYPWLGCSLIDLDPDGGEAAGAVAERLRKELRTGDDLATALRARNRWVLDFTPQSMPEASQGRILRRNGVFVVVGDLGGGLGKVWAEALAKQPGVKLALLQHKDGTAIPTPEGVEIIDRQLDCADPATLSAALVDITERWRRIDGIFLSGPMSNHPAVAPLALLTDGHWSYNLASQIAPLRALAQVLSERPACFCCVQGSLSSIVGGPALAAYASAHHVVDSFVAACDRKGSTPWFAINWDGINDQRTDRGASRGDTVNSFALSAEEAWDCTRRILEAGMSGQTIVSKGDLTARRAHWLHTKPLEDEKPSTGRHKRPDLATKFLAPRNEIEATVVEIFQDILGIDRVGTDDGFFDLGGHSLLAIRAVAKLREAFPVDVQMRELLFDNPTAAGVARTIASNLTDELDQDTLDELLRQVEAMSEDEVNKHTSLEGPSRERVL